MNISKISYSSWKDYQKCQYYYLQKHVKGIRLPFIGTVHSAFGVSIHYVLEKTIPNKMERALANQIFLTKFDEELLKSKVILPNKDEWIQKANKILDNFWLKHFNKLKNNVYKTEWKFKIPMLENKYIIVGIIDHCTFTKAGGIGVIDYKTGKSHKPNEQNAMQLSMYSLAIEKSLNLIPEWFCLMYLEHDENQFS